MARNSVVLARKIRAKSTSFCGEGGVAAIYILLDSVGLRRRTDAARPHIAASVSALAAAAVDERGILAGAGRRYEKIRQIRPGTRICAGPHLPGFHISLESGAVLCVYAQGIEIWQSRRLRIPVNGEQPNHYDNYCYY
jgi:hypothetical protein